MDDPGFEKMGKPKPGEWLYHFHERGQSFEDYVSSHPMRTTAGRRVLVLQPVGPFSPLESTILGKATEFAGIWFDLPTRLGRTYRGENSSGETKKSIHYSSFYRWFIGLHW
jgi:hypothetical protein